MGHMLRRVAEQALLYATSDGNPLVVRLLAAIQSGEALGHRTPLRPS